MGIFDRPLEAVVVTTNSDTTIRGLLVQLGPNGIVLRAAQIVRPDQNGQPTWLPLDGETVIPVENIDYYQRSRDIPALLG